MANFFSLSRELRDMIYREVFDGNTSLKPSPQPRKCLARNRPTTQGPLIDEGNQDRPSTGVSVGERNLNEAGTQVGAHSQPQLDYLAGEATIRYSLAEPIPPTSSVLQACRQLRTEMLDAIRRNKVRYKVRLAFRDDADAIYPTWVSLPAFASHIHVLDVEIRTRGRKTPSLFSTETADSAAGWKYDDRDSLLGGMVLLRRFLERGPLFIAKKKAKKTTIETLVLHIEPKDRGALSPSAVFADTVDMMDDLLLHELAEEYDDIDYRDEFFRFFSERITRVQCRVGEHCKEWLSADILTQVNRRQERKG
ncbi:hypothetical protein MMC10_009373 [Thelotrema lepadinum]|nr:hypothetical protein [Thelotrema lepadinum]